MNRASIAVSTAYGSEEAYVDIEPYEWDFGIPPLNGRQPVVLFAPGPGFAGMAWLSMWAEHVAPFQHAYSLISVSHLVADSVMLPTDRLAQGPPLPLHSPHMTKDGTAHRMQLAGAGTVMPWVQKVGTWVKRKRKKKNPASPGRRLGEKKSRPSPNL